MYIYYVHSPSVHFCTYATTTETTASMNKIQTLYYEQLVTLASPNMSNIEELGSNYGWIVATIPYLMSPILMHVFDGYLMFSIHLSLHFQ